MVNWKKNLIVIWLAQFLAISGFAFSIPFVPFYFQELGITEGVQLKQYVALFGSLAPLTLAISSPFWGAVGDRYGRRLMLLRANFAASIILTCMGLVSDAELLLCLRAGQGIFTGTMTASQTLVSVNTPEKKHGLALGALSSAIFSGSLFGAFIGGNFAELYGHSNAFYLSGLLTFSSALLILIGVREDFCPPKKVIRQKGEKFRIKSLLINIGPAAPILVLLVAMSFTRQFDSSFLPLLVQEVNGKLQGSASITGSLSAIGGLAGFFAGIIMGRLADRFSPPKIAMISALFAGIFMFPQGFADGFLLIFITRFFMIFFSGGLDPILQVWIAKVTPSHLRGSIFGWAGSAKAVGWMFAPVTSGAVAMMMGIRSIYWLGTCFFLLLIPMIYFVVQYLKTHVVVGTTK
ncbi:MFS transporter [bacterium]|nr:MFS transporter [bacterium]